MGITAQFLKPILKKVSQDARKLLRPGPIHLEHNKAPVYQCIVREGDLCGFDAITIAAGKAPDMSLLDAGVSVGRWRMRWRRRVPSPLRRSDAQ